MERESSSRMQRFFPDVCQLRSRCSSTSLNLKTFHQTQAHLPQNATGVVTKNIWFFWKNKWIFPKNLKNFTIAKRGNFFEECVSNGIISLKCLFYPSFEVFFSLEIRKFSKLAKLEKMMRKRSIFKKKTLSPFKNASYQNEKTESEVVVAGRLV